MRVPTKMTNAIRQTACGVLLFLATGLAWADVLYVHTDHLGTPRLMTNEQGTTVWRNLPTTEPFGNAPVEEDPDGDSTLTTFNQRFPGQYYDKETNLNYNYFRDYDPSTGRYVQSDPIGLRGGVNTYSYVEGNPLSGFDLWGLAEICKKIIEQEWKEIGRGWKIIGYRYRKAIDGPIDIFMNAVTTLMPGFGMVEMIPIERDLGLEQLFELDVELCYDECTKITTRRVLFTNPRKQFRETWYNPHLGDRDGDPVWRTTTDVPPSFDTRWGRR